MMSEKRFTLDDEENGLCRCILVDGEEIPTCEICDLLNEQQATIKHIVIERHKDDKRFQTLIAELKKENEQLKEQLDKCRRLKLSDKAIKQAYAELNRREREKHCNGDITLTATLPYNEVVY